MFYFILAGAQLIVTALLLTDKVHCDESKIKKYNTRLFITG